MGPAEVIPNPGAGPRRPGPAPDPAAFGHSLDLGVVLDGVMTTAVRLTGAEGGVALVAAPSGVLTLAATRGLEPAGLIGLRVTLADRGIAELLGRRRPGPVDPSALPELLAATLSGRGGALAVPLVREGCSVGLLLLALPARPRPVADEAALAALADQAAVAVDHAQRYAEATARGERLLGLLDLGRALVEPRPASELTVVAAGAARRLLSATAASCRVREGDELVLGAWAGPAAAGGPGAPRLRVGEGLCGRVAQGGQAIRLLDTRDTGPEHAAEGQALAATGLLSCLAVPLRVLDRVTGVLAVYDASPGRFDDDEATALSGLADQVAAALEQGRLIQELVHAERLSAVGRIMAGVAHELNNPLAVVVGTADLLRREILDPGMAERLARISAQAHRAVKIVRSLLALARKKPAQRGPVDVNRLLDETLDLEGYCLRGAQVTVVRRLARNLPPALGDADQLQQVFTNLVLNASEALREARRSGTLVVTTGRDPESERLVVTIADDGPGIAARDLPRIFEPFFTTRGDGQGTGLGLPICRQIIESHQGRIAVHSESGQGATFTIELPEARVAAGRSDEAPAREREAPAGVEVLLVEDETVVGDLLAEYLGLEGHRVDRAGNGREALDRVRAGRAYRLIVSDVRMPDVDGPTFYQELRTVNPELTRRMVFVTGDVMSPDTRRFLDETGLLYLEKPFGIADFLGVVRRALADPTGLRPVQPA